MSGAQEKAGALLFAPALVLITLDKYVLSGLLLFVVCVVYLVGLSHSAKY